MELTVQRELLQRELQLCQGIAGAADKIPILANVLVEAREDSTLGITTTNLEVALRSRCPAAVTTKGSTSVPARKFFELVRAIPDESVKLSARPGTVEIRADGFDARLQTMPVSDFPDVPVPEDLAAESLDTGKLRELIARTWFATTGDDSRFFLNGSLLILRAGLMKMVATDGHRLSIASADRDPEGGSGTGDEEARKIIPKKTLKELEKLLGEDEDKVVLRQGESHLFFDAGNRQLVSRVIDAVFPQYERVIPAPADHRVEFQRAQLEAAIRRVALLAGRDSQAVKLQIEAGKTELKAASADAGEASESLLVDYEGPEMEVSFNAEYLNEFLSAAGSDGVTLEMKDEKSQAIMCPTGERKAYTYVIMPMRM